MGGKGPNNGDEDDEKHRRLRDERSGQMLNSEEEKKP